MTLQMGIMFSTVYGGISLELGWIQNTFLRESQCTTLQCYKMGM